MTNFINNTIKVFTALGGLGCITAAYFGHKEKWDDWGWFLFAGIILLGGVMQFISEEKK